MFEWLELEIAAIKTPRFHVVDGAVNAEFRANVNRWTTPALSGYTEFVLKFGNSKLYHVARDNSYQVGVFRAPREAVLANGRTVYVIGYHDGASVYVKNLLNRSSARIYEFERKEEAVAATFEEWLTKSCAQARTRYRKKEWNQILIGPVPFSPEEEKIVEARKVIRWKVVGIDAKGNHIFEVANRSERRLAAITIGVRSKDSHLNGAIRLPISDIAPGKTGLAYASCYKDIVAPEAVEVFALPDPKPEDRDFYWEFKEN